MHLEPGASLNSYTVVRLQRGNPVDPMAFTGTEELSGTGNAVTVGGPTFITDCESAYARELRAAVDELPPTISVETRLVSGKAAKRILEVADECSCDLIVMGFHGHGRLHHALMGSVSATVLRESKRPVLLVRKGDEVPAPTPAPASPITGAEFDTQLPGRTARIDG